MRGLTKHQKQDRRRILEISFKHNLSHLGSCLSAIDLIAAIYQIKKIEEKFVLSSGHAGLALYVVLERFEAKDAEKLLLKNGIHPDRAEEDGIYCSSGSLGHGLPIALGMALADRKKRVFCLISDGECTHGSIWESLRIAQELRLNNLTVVINANGWGAYNQISISKLIKQLKGFGDLILTNGHDPNSLTKLLTKKASRPKIVLAKTMVEQLPFLLGQDSHYRVMKLKDYKSALEVWRE